MSLVIGQVCREVVGCRNWPAMRVPLFIGLWRNGTFLITLYFSLGLFRWHYLTEIILWISNYIIGFIQDVITNPLSNFNSGLLTFRSC